jgi:DNA-binding GntR family transcriptional regulator
MEKRDRMGEERPEKKLLPGRKVLREQIKEYLVDAILRGEYGAGDRIVETRVAQQLGVSQGAVREALRELEWMGFLETTPYSGTYVKAMSADDFQEIYPVRAVLEALGARLATPRLTEAQLDELQQLVDEMVCVSEAGDERGMVERNYAFHQMIIHASANSVLIRSWSMFQFSYWTSIATSELHGDLVFLARRHYDILTALRTRDPDYVAQTMHNHISHLAELVARHQPHAVPALVRSKELETNKTKTTAE